MKKQLELLNSNTCQRIWLWCINFIIICKQNIESCLEKGVLKEDLDR